MGFIFSDFPLTVHTAISVTRHSSELGRKMGHKMAGKGKGEDKGKAGWQGSHFNTPVVILSS